jgi:hypothetical protein
LSAKYVYWRIFQRTVIDGHRVTLAADVSSTHLGLAVTPALRDVRSSARECGSRQIRALRLGGVGSRLWAMSDRDGPRAPAFSGGGP